MCGKAYDPRLIVAWPNAKIAVMGGAQAAKVLLQIQVASLKAKGEVITPEKEKELLDKITNHYNETMDPYYGAARLWVDTRKWVSMGIEMAEHNAEIKPFSTGVIQV